jgi:hypothetical protein
MSIIQLANDIQDMEEFEPLPDGVYPAELQDIELRFSEKMPNGYLYCVFTISPDSFPADYDAGNAPEGLQVVYSRTGIPDPSNRRSVRPFKMFLNALGVKIKGTDFDPQAWVGSSAQLLLKRQEYQGAMINNVESVSPLPKV